MLRPFIVNMSVLCYFPYITDELKPENINISKTRRTLLRVIINTYEKEKTEYVTYKIEDI